MITVEHMAVGSKLDPAQEAFIEQGAFHQLLDEHPNPDDDQHW